MEKTLRQWLDRAWLCWGLGPYIAVNLGYFGTSALLEGLIWSGTVKHGFIEYGEDSREEALSKQTLPFWTQLRVATWNIMGPMALFNVAVTAVTLPRLIRSGADAALLPTSRRFLEHFVAMELIGDFFLYVGHRILHEWLWDYHKFHHSISTPTPVSTACIDPLDATVQAGLPRLAAAVMTQPHPLTFCAYLMASVAENVLNHSGLDHWFTNLLFLKMLPFRASVAVHDAHHKYSNYPKNAKNFGENFWLWDWAFGSLGKVGEATRHRCETERLAKICR